MKLYQEKQKWNCFLRNNNACVIYCLYKKRIIQQFFRHLLKTKFKTIHKFVLRHFTIKCLKFNTIHNFFCLKTFYKKCLKYCNKIPLCNSEPKWIFKKSNLEYKAKATKWEGLCHKREPRQMLSTLTGKQKP